jgi:DNA primase
MIPREVIDQIRDRLDIVDLVSDYLQLKQSGDNFKAICPFHKEKTPSFNVSRSKQIFHCFGCGKGGDVFRFLMFNEGISFGEAARVLADRAGVTIPKSYSREGKHEALREKLQALNSFAADYYAANLLKKKSGGVCRTYLKSREIDSETAKRFGLGYATDSWDDFYNTAQQHGFTAELLTASGLVRQRPQGDGCYDIFRNRLMFPIHDHVGVIIGFGGRTLGDDDAKYINSPETASYRKGYTLYGLHLAKQALRDQNRAIVVEGYFDLVRVAQAGVENVVATLGTALTEPQAALLKRYASNVTLVYDSDEAGVKAATRGLQVLVAKDLASNVALLPGSKDPDDFVRENGAEAFKEQLLAAPGFLDFVTKDARDPSLDVNERIEIAQNAFDIIRNVRNELRKSEYLRVLADKLRIDEQSVRKAFQNGRRRSATATDKATVVDKPVEARVDILRLIATSPEYRARAREDDPLGSIEAGAERDVLEVLLDDAFEPTRGAQLFDLLEDDAAKELLSWVLMEDTIEFDAEKAFRDWKAERERKKYGQQAAALRGEIAVAEREGRFDDLKELLNRSAELKRKIDPAFSAGAKGF